MTIKPERRTEGALTVLGIETSCDETAAAVVRREVNGSGTILSNIVLSQLDEHAPFGGVVPEIAARAHIVHLDSIIARAMRAARTSFGDLDGVAATAGPGLIGGLIVGLTTAKSIALAAGLPLVAVNHLEGHALTPRLTSRLAFPYLLLLVSGGHTQFQLVEDVGRYRRLGTTIDDALGEAFDKTAKLLGLGYPGGPAIESHARAGDPERFAFPRPMTGREGCDFSFSGLKTAVRRAAQQTAPVSERDIADICAGFQAAIADCVADRLKHAIALMRQASPPVPETLVVGGGVAANAALRARIAAVCATEGLALDLPPAALCTDNAAMIAWAGAERLARQLCNALDAPALARWPLDPHAPAAPGAGVKA